MKFLNGAQAIKNWVFRKVATRGQPKICSRNYLHCRRLLFSAPLGEMQEKSETVQSDTNDTNSRAPSVVLCSVTGDDGENLITYGDVLLPKLSLFFCLLSRLV
jgi:hypothetical protein